MDESTQGKVRMRRYGLLLVKFLFASLFIFAGVMHFANEGFFMKIMPPYLPWHRELVYISGIAEIALGGALLVPRFQRIAAWGLIALLVAVFPANIHVYMNQQIIPAPGWVHTLRLILQGILVAWAWSYTRSPSFR
jgi:uncharacterized membrane protein